MKTIVELVKAEYKMYEDALERIYGNRKVNKNKQG